MERIDDAAPGTLNAPETPSDAELLLRLRGGDARAYEALWSRHIGAALRLARRIDRDRAEDLVSESFLAVYRQVTTTDAGPTEAFRAYLFTVIRNTAARWGREMERFPVLPDAEPAHADDGLSIVSREADAAEVLAAFRALPERWQRVLWLSEVDEVPRPRIAAELRIRPNAVSSLHRRARAGLLNHWLIRQVPDALRADTAHRAELLPGYVIGNLAAAERVAAEAHIAVCAVCAELLGDLRSSASTLQRATLSTAGFAALGSTLPAASPLVAPAAAGGAALLLGVASQLGPAGTTMLGGLGIAACGTAIAVALVTGSVLGGGASDAGGRGSAPGTSSTERTSATEVSEARDPAPPRIAVQDGTEDSDTEQFPRPGTPTPPSEIRTGRHNTDSSIPELPLVDGWPQPEEPEPQRPRPDTGPGPQTETPALAPGLRTPADSTGYFAPVIAGRTSPGAQIAVSIAGKQYSTPVDPSGGWSFDLRAFSATAGSTEYSVWAYAGDQRSASVVGRYTLLPVAVRGFEGTPAMDISEAKTTGLVLQFQGAPSGTVCLQSMAGQVASVPLDTTGSAVRRLRMQSGGFYMFTFRACDGAFRGSPVETYATVDDPDAPIFGPWGPDPEEQTFELSEL
ncbi:sigma-70 family RNA polymerase sigma factor [Leucobacter iarius]|uniref:RNA polymerase sigma factor (Sigma-70 family) n=1 Tax=Leucobacter iarius TaxID=333963 RepID=A0ABP4XJR6_9MICO